jgi:hypothetical protein
MNGLVSGYGTDSDEEDSTADAVKNGRPELPAGSDGNLAQFRSPNWPASSRQICRLPWKQPTNLLCKI